MRANNGRYSRFLRPLSYLVDISVVIFLAKFFNLSNSFVSNYQLFISIFWVLSSLYIGFYEIYRYTKILDILSKILKQYFIFLLINLAYLGYYLKEIEPFQMLKFVSFSLLIISTIKFSIYFLIKKFRVAYDGNFREVILIGKEKNIQELKNFFAENPHYGYKLVKTFDNSDILIDECLKYVEEQKVDEIYGAYEDLNQTEVEKLISFADNNLKVIKFLPNKNEILSQNMNIDYYGYIPIVSLRVIPLDKTFNQLVKRIFDIIFSLIVIILVLSWLIPLMAILIKLESKGPLFFMQKRNGLNYTEFNCFKFRSMAINEEADLEQVSKNDPRITKVGAFIRKTSIDELPQFFNVFLGDMSVCGPRPHMVSHTEMYAKRVDKFMVRHLIKPGITGLAQTNGYRGEVETEADIINRVKFDIYYLENWSLLLDLKIVFFTVFNAIKGEEKAY